MITADTLTDAQLRIVIAKTLEGRQNASKRSLRKDAQAALAGDAFCRGAIAEDLQRDVSAIALPPELVDAIERYIETDWSKKNDPSRLGGLNAVAYLGERLVALYQQRRIDVLGGDE